MARPLTSSQVSTRDVTPLRRRVRRPVRGSGAKIQSPVASRVGATAGAGPGPVAATVKAGATMSLPALSRRSRKRSNKHLWKSQSLG